MQENLIIWRIKDEGISEMADKMIVYIYTFPNGKRYIGQTINTLEERAGSNGHRYAGQLVYSAIQKYGWNNIQKEIIQCSSIEEMNTLETQLINKYHTTNENYGYNCDSGGNNKIASEATREKLRQSHLGLKMPDAHKLNTSLHNFHNTAVYCIETEKVYRSFAEAGRQLGGLSPSSIGQVCAGDKQRHTVGGYHFRYATTEEIQELKESI